MAFDSVHNYYERLVFNELLTNRESYKLPNDLSLLEDVACVALNKLPGRYIRHDIDLAFYLTSDERMKLEVTVREAVEHATDYVMNHPRYKYEAEEA